MRGGMSCREPASRSACGRAAKLLHAARHRPRRGGRGLPGPPIAPDPRHCAAGRRNIVPRLAPAWGLA